MKLNVTTHQAQLLVALIDFRLRGLRNSVKEPILPIRTRDRLRSEIEALESLLRQLHKEAPLV